MGKIFVFMGKSASGKDTIFNLVSKKLTNLNIIIPYTTRPIRENEKDGVNYYFITDNEFKTMLDNNQVIEYRTYQTEYGPWTYLTSSLSIDDDKDYININTLEGYQKLVDYYGSDRVIPIYIEIDDYTRLYRALSREHEQKNPKYDEMCRRFLADKEDFSEDKLVGINKRYNNSNLDYCLFQIINDINNILESKKIKRY